MSDPVSIPHLFVFGLGYSANAFAAVLRETGTRISATCRSAEKQAALIAQGIDAHVFDRDHPLDDAGRAALDQASHLLSSVPPDDQGDPVVDLHAQDILKAAPFDWIGYLSTTGVYGDCDGDWVDETAPMAPSGMRGQRRVDAEAAWFALAPAGALDTVRQGRARRVVKPGQVFSRIHIDDITNILLASAARPNPGAAYNCCDDEAAPPQDVITYACDLLGVTPPPEIPFEEADLSPMAKSFYRDNKRVSNKRIKEELGVTLRWPNYRDALTAMLSS